MKPPAAGELAAGPSLFAIGLAVMYFVPEIGPLDRAKVQGLIGLPLLALGPAVAGLAGRMPDVQLQARLVIRLTATAIGVLVAVATAISVASVRCRPVASPIDALPEAVIVGVLAAISYGLGGTVALGSAARGRLWIALAQGTATFIAAAALSVAVIVVALFPPLSCAPPP